MFVGPGTPSSSGTLSSDNLSGVDPLFVDRANYDYHLLAGSPAIGKAVMPMPVDTLVFVAMSEYVHPLGEATRASAHDVGAFEFGTDTTAERDAGAMDVDAGSSTAGADAAVHGAGGARAVRTAALPARTRQGRAARAVQVARTRCGAIARSSDAGADAAAGTSHSDSDASGCGCAVLGARRDAASNAWLSSAALACLVGVRWGRRLRAGGR